MFFTAECLSSQKNTMISFEDLEKKIRLLIDEGRINFTSSVSQYENSSLRQYVEHKNKLYDGFMIPQSGSTESNRERFICATRQYPHFFNNNLLLATHQAFQRRANYYLLFSKLEETRKKISGDELLAHMMEAANEPHLRAILRRTMIRSIGEYKKEASNFPILYISFFLPLLRAYGEKDEQEKTARCIKKHGEDYCLKLDIPHGLLQEGKAVVWKNIKGKASTFDDESDVVLRLPLPLNKMAMGANAIVPLFEMVRTEHVLLYKFYQQRLKSLGRSFYRWQTSNVAFWDRLNNGDESYGQLILLQQFLDDSLASIEWLEETVVQLDTKMNEEEKGIVRRRVDSAQEADTLEEQKLLSKYYYDMGCIDEGISLWRERLIQESRYVKEDMSKLETDYS